MKARMDLTKGFPDLYNAMLGLENAVRNSGIEKSLYELIKIRASQINGCVFCINMHTKDARAGGETEQRIYGLSAWQEAPYYSDRERAALALTESVTLLASTHVPDDVYNAAAAIFTEKELGNIIMAIVVINGWNRICVTTRTQPV
ncbi:carboxymuconolactone decarboxylase family protein [Chitinophaga sp. MM2321]|uniref:carboxymuconolactone decarboxylase family protein n=1 Tax=Chitinophaga sp. MM2321 TaxID=3137178 RepID=UPI0032D59821